MSRILAAAAVAAFAMSVGGTVSAATTSLSFGLGCGGAVRCDPTGYDRLAGSSFDLSEGGVALNVAAGAFKDFTVGSYDPATGAGTLGTADLASAARIGRYGGGAGIVNSKGDEHTIDGNVSTDFVQLAFSTIVSLTGLDFGFNKRSDGTNSKFRVLLDTNGDGKIGAGDFFSGELFTASKVRFLTPIDGKIFGIAAAGAGDTFKLTSVNAGVTAPAPVPLPAAAWMLLAGIGGLFGLRRRKAAA